MAERGVDTFVSHEPVSIYYLTTFANIAHERPFLLVIRAYGRPLMVAPLLELSHVRHSDTVLITDHGPVSLKSAQESLVDLTIRL